MNDLFTLFTARLQAAGIEHAVTGSIAAMVYGEPRLTHDIDLVVVLDDAAIQAAAEAFPGSEFYCPPIEVMQVEARRPQRGHFNIIHHESGFKADVYVAAEDPLHRWALDNRRTIAFAGTELHFAPPEYVIVRKLEYYREGGSEKHLRDIRGILRHQGESLDTARLEQLIDERTLRDAWNAVRGVRG